MAIRISFEIDGIAEFDRTFTRIGDTLEDLRPVWDDVQTEFYAIEREQFKSEGSSGASGKWAALTPKYAAYKALKFPGQPILQRTGALMRSLTGDNSDGVVQKEKQEFTIGTNIPYAGFHQQGTSRMTSRPVISLSAAQKNRLQKTIQKSLIAAMRLQRGVPARGK